MSIDEIERAIPLRVDQLFDHSPFVRAEIECMRASFERNERFREFDGLIRTNHKMYAAAETKFDGQKAADRLRELAKRTEELAERMEQIGRPHFTKEELDSLEPVGKSMSEIARMAESKQRDLEEKRGEGRKAGVTVMARLEEDEEGRE